MTHSDRTDSSPAAPLVYPCRADGALAALRAMMRHAPWEAIDATMRDLEALRDSCVEDGRLGGAEKYDAALLELGALRIIRRLADGRRGGARDGAGE